MIKFQDTVETTKNILLNPECFHFASSVRSPSGEDEEVYLRLSGYALKFATAEECRAYIEDRLRFFESCGRVPQGLKDARIFVREDEGEREGCFELVWSLPEAYLIFTLSTGGCPVEDAIAEFESVGFVREW